MHETRRLLKSHHMLDGKRGIVLGLANKRSLAWGIAKACAVSRARLAVTVQSERFVETAERLTERLHAPEEIPIYPMEVTDTASIERVAAAVERRWGGLDFLVHSIAYANPAELRGNFRDTTRAGFANALDISAFSLVAAARAFAPLMTEGGSIVALSYLGGERVVPNYNVMGVAKAALDSAVRYLAHDLGPAGIRVNAVAPGPVRTVSAAAIGNFGKMLDHVAAAAPLRRNIDTEDVGSVVAFLVSDMASAITGVTLPVDCGYSIMGVTSTFEDESD